MNASLREALPEGNVTCLKCAAVIAWKGELPGDCLRCGSSLACPECGQIDLGQTGEYPCPTCGVPRTWDAPVAASDYEATVAHA